MFFIYNKVIMSLFQNNILITQEYELQYNTIKYNNRIKRDELRNRIASVATKHAKLILESKDLEDIGNPTRLCDELLELKLAYNNIITNEKEELKRIMDRYKNKLFENMIDIQVNNQNDDIKLRVYETYMSKPVKQWDIEKGGLTTEDGTFLRTISVDNGSHPTIHPQALPPEIWLSAFKNTIDTKISEEIEAKNKFLNQNIF